MNRRKFLGVFAAAASSGLPTQGLAGPPNCGLLRAKHGYTACRSSKRPACALTPPSLRRARAAATASMRSFTIVIWRLPAERLVTSPNVNTLYSLAFVDLGNGPATVTLPATGERYFSLQLMDMYTNSFAVLGTRTIGSDGDAFMLVGPRDAAPAGAIRVPHAVDLGSCPCRRERPGGNGDRSQDFRTGSR